MKNNLKKIRTEKNISRKEMADLLKIPYSTYSNYENGYREMSLSTIFKASDILGVGVDELMGISDPETFDIDVNDLYNNSFFDENDSECVEDIIKKNEEFDRYQEEKEVKEYINIPESEKISDLFKYFSNLNDIGQAISVKRTKEVFDIKKYRKNSDYMQTKSKKKK